MSSILKILTKLCNQILHLDPSTFKKIAILDGNLFAFEVLPEKYHFYLSIHQHGIKWDSLSHGQSPDVVLTGTILDFIILISKKNTLGLPNNMQLSGNIHLAQKLQEIIRGLDIDLEEQASHYIGDALAYQLGIALHQGRQLSEEISKKLSLDTSEYLRFESQLLPDMLMVESFCKEVDLLREDTERLIKRFEQITCP